MAKYECKYNGSLQSAVKLVEDGILNTSWSATLEEKSDIRLNGTAVSVRAFERYSWLGGNRVSLNVTFVKAGDSPVYIIATTTGGSQALFTKINTFGEDAFLERLKEIFENN